MPRGVPNPKPDTAAGNPAQPGDRRSKYDRDRCVNPGCTETCNPECENLVENIDYEQWNRENNPKHPLAEGVVGA